MPQRLRDLSQAWGELAVRGFEQSAKSVADRNDRDRENLRYIGASVAAGITNKKQKERQDRLRAEENAREDKIRAEQYARQDKRYAVEDARSAEHRQFERDTAAVKWTADARDAAAKEYAEATTPEAAQTAADRLRQYSAQYDQLMGRLTGFAKSQEQAAPPVVSPDAEVIGAPTSKPMSKGDPNRIPYTQPFATGPSAMLNVPAGPRAMPIPPAPEMPPSVVPSGSPRAEAPMPDLLPEERAVMGYQQRQAAAEKRQASALALASRLDADARSAKTELRAADLRRQAQAARDAAAAAQEDSSTAGNLAAQFSEKAAVRKTEMAKADENRKAMRDLSIVVKQNGDPRVIGAFLRALKEGASPEAAELIVTGTMKTKDWERAQAAKKPELTPEQKAAAKVAEDISLANERRKNYLDVSTGKPLPTEEEWQAKNSEAGQKRYAAQVGAVERVDRDTWQRKEPQWEEFPTDELTAVMNDSSVSPEMRDKFAAEFYRRYPNPSSLEKVQDAVTSGMSGEGAPVDAKSARTKPGGLDAAKAAFNNLPASERDTPEKARAAKARIMAEYGVR